MRHFTLFRQALQQYNDQKTRPTAKELMNLFGVECDSVESRVVSCESDFIEAQMEEMEDVVEDMDE
eukprot:4487509-Amphidinium_carterae.1